MLIRNVTVETPQEDTHLDNLKSDLAEFIPTFIFVFAGSGSYIAYNKLSDNSAATPVGLISVSITHASLSLLLSQSVLTLLVDTSSPMSPSLLSSGEISSSLNSLDPSPPAHSSSLSPHRYDSYFL